MTAGMEQKLCRNGGQVAGDNCLCGNCVLNDRAVIEDISYVLRCFRNQHHF